VAAETGPCARMPSPEAATTAMSQRRTFFIVR
jgi:hypothetical protein